MYTININILIVGMILHCVSTSAFNPNRPMRIHFTVKQEGGDGREFSWTKATTSDHFFKDCFIVYGGEKHSITYSREELGIQESNPRENFAAHDEESTGLDAERRLWKHNAKHSDNGGIRRRVRRSRLSRKENFDKNFKLNENPKLETIENFIISCRTFEKNEVIDFGASLEGNLRQLNVKEASMGSPSYSAQVSNGQSEESQEILTQTLKDQALLKKPSLYRWPPLAPTDESTFVRINQRHMNGPIRNNQTDFASSKFILAVLGGVIGFIVVQAAVVIAVRHFSTRRSEERRRVEMEVGQSVGLDEVFKVESLSKLNHQEV